MKKEIKIGAAEAGELKMLQEVLQKLERIETENKKLRAENTELKANILEYQKNGVTGLRNRRAFYHIFESDIKENAGEFLKDIELLEDDELKEKVEKWDLEKIKNNKLSIALGDLAYLKLVNDTLGHDVGDEFLKNIGDIAREELGSPEIGISEEKLKEMNFIAARAGEAGDEFLAIIRKNLEDADKTSKEFSLKVENSKIQALEKLGLKPHMDVGTAHISEGLEAFKELIGAGAKIPSGNRMREIENLMIKIADLRQTIDKIKNKILILMEKRSKAPGIYKKLKVRSAEIEDEEIDHLIAIKNGGFEKILDDFVDKKVDQNLEETSREIQKQISLKQNIIKKIARRKR